jgi:hypothetical protein
MWNDGNSRDRIFDAAQPDVAGGRSARLRRSLACSPLNARSLERQTGAISSLARAACATERPAVRSLLIRTRTDDPVLGSLSLIRLGCCLSRLARVPPPLGRAQDFPTPEPNRACFGQRLPPRRTHLSCRDRCPRSGGDRRSPHTRQSSLPVVLLAEAERLYRTDATSAAQSSSRESTGRIAMKLSLSRLPMTKIRRHCSSSGSPGAWTPANAVAVGRTPRSLRAPSCVRR